MISLTNSRGFKNAHLQRMGKNPAYNSRIPPSRARRVKPLTSPVAYPRRETRRIRVASIGVRIISAQNLLPTNVRLSKYFTDETHSATLAEPR